MVVKLKVENGKELQHGRNSLQTLVNHPSAVWVRQSSRHYQWLYRLFMWLCVEYTYRYGKIHSTERLLGDLLGYTPKGLKDNGFTEPPQCMGL